MRICLLLLAGVALAPAQSVRHSGFDAFHKGTLGNAGANLYVSSKGAIQVVNRWDLNNDGYNDVLISNDHDVFEIVDAFVYWNSAQGFSSLLPDWHSVEFPDTRSVSCRTARR